MVAIRQKMMYFSLFGNQGNEMKEDLLIPFAGAVLAALIAGCISLALAILTKDQKTSEFRQAWIDALRTDVALLAGTVSTVMDIALDRAGGDENNQEALYEALHEKHPEFISAATCIIRIRLRLNPTEHSEILELLDKLSTEGIGADNTRRILNDLVNKIQPVLKDEWRRVKRGELSYRILKWGSLVAVSIAIAVSVNYFWPIDGWLPKLPRLP